ncbi:calcium/sodium antiporter [Legionella spiritensis]|uniref:Na/Ca antiporter n=1 Tax=Legionella spiritensis TaxID=452 RepID=A0A0W0Z3D7_LEGSP|nr:calcium/sodium antiporter [Legionella spiritensis]KTD63359.1 Na/Ca antiporter [Legionella spiritensis]SNV35365.1 Ca2 /Na antiporter [Legionella spiritensis]
MYNIFILILSIAAMLWSASHLVSGASGIAFYYRLPPFLIGFTLVAIGTSAPEIMIAINASMDGLNDIAIGNVIGTNIANIGLVLGLTALIKPLKMQSSLLRREYPLLFLVMLFTYSLMLDGYLGIMDSCLFLLACIGLLGYLLLRARRSVLTNRVALDFQQAWLQKRSVKIHTVHFILGFLILAVSTKYFISSSVILAKNFGVSDLVIGLTLVAIGSSLPELITSVMAAVKGADDIAVGNILGANVFNLLAVMIFPGIIHPALISHAVLWRDIPVMFATTLVLLWFSYRNKKALTRWHGVLLILIYCSYILSILISANH